MSDTNKISKISRQLALFHMFLCSKIVEFEDIESIINIGPKSVTRKTITRDLKELHDAGLINVTYSRKEKGYVHIDGDDPCPFLPPIYSDNKARNRHLEKLIRLATIMIKLAGHMEQPYYYEDSMGQETCVTWYQKTFPNLSVRTMRRDFKELNKIGYVIEYSQEDKCYTVSFPETSHALEFNSKY